MQDFKSFVKTLIDNPELYDNYKTFYISMRNADTKTKAIYDEIKNSIMSYVAKENRDKGVEAELNPQNETFIARDSFAKFVLFGGQLYIHLRVDPRLQSTREAMYKVLNNDTIVYKLGKDNVTKQVLSIIPKIMASEGFVSVRDYNKEEYSSFFSREIDDAEVTESIVSSQQDFEERESRKLNEEEFPVDASETIENTKTDDVDDYGDYYNPVIQKRNLHIEIPSGTPSKEEIDKAKATESANKRKKPKLFRELARYGYEFIWFKIVAFYVVTILAAIGLAIAFRLKIFWTIVLGIGFLLMMPMVVKAYFRKKYEEKRYIEVTTYIEQMLYSFRKNSKILASLRDALVVFPTTSKMYDTILKAIHYAQTASEDGNIYERAFRIIEDEYPCRRIQSLHRYMIKVEHVGGEHSMGVDALLRDRRLWVERIDGFKKDAAAVLTDIYISIGFSIGLACLIVRIMETPMVDIPSNFFYQISTVIFLLICALTVCLSVKKTVLMLNDKESVENSQKIINKINWIRTYNGKEEFKKSLILAGIFAIFLLVGLLMKNMLLIILGAIFIFYALCLKVPMQRNSAIKSISRTIEKVYPDWLLELALLLQIDNLHVAIEKTLDSAPLILKGDLIKLDNDIVTNPTGIEPFSSFFDFLPIPHVHSSMLLLYSISEFGQEKGNAQLMELIERNSSMMDKAEKYRNDDRLSATFILKFIPMGISAMKLMCDLAIMLISYMSILTGVL